MNLWHQTAPIGVLAAGLLIAIAGCTAPSAGVTLQTISSAMSSTGVSSTASDISADPPTPSSSEDSSKASNRGTTSERATPPPATSAITPVSEGAQRQAIETLWALYWTTGARAIRSTPAEQRAMMSNVAVEPALGRVLAGFAKFAKNGWTDYGTIAHRPYWETPVSGRQTAIMGDCMDDSKAGSADIATGRKLTVGVARDNVRVSVIKTVDGWRVEKVEYLVTVPC